ncbi:MAG: hypothetical protein M5R36_13320 [Deltaproteobacteria bacterium]|nr:hypothetical protein [Deltaproteobacteria bacterium]
MRILMIALAMMLCAGMVYAQDDDTAPMDDDMDDDATDDDVDEFTATLEFNDPEALEADMEYEFSLRVTNTTVASETRRWINDVELFMPTTDYSIDEGSLTGPNSLHPDYGDWDAAYGEGDTWKGIRWLFSGLVTSESYGDIREGEYLDFAFNATTDGDATDGFGWYIEADSGEFVEGTAFIGSEGEDDDADDDFGDDDSAPLASGDDDDDSGGGCGC